MRDQMSLHSHLIPHLTYRLMSPSNPFMIALPKAKPRPKTIAARNNISDGSIGTSSVGVPPTSSRGYLISGISTLISLGGSPFLNAVFFT